MHKESHVFDSLLIVVFIVVSFLPLFLTHNGDVSPIEKRKLTPFPELKLERTIIDKFPSQFEAFFNDHFGFRDHFAKIYNIFSLILQSSPNKNVLIGKEDWLFYINPDDGNSLEDYRKNDPLTQEELREWRSVLDAKYSFLKLKGIQYLFIIVPDKHSIYPEYFPSRIHQVGKQSRLDQLMDYMRDSEVQILDLRPSLIGAKKQGLLYFKTDTHWNALGAAFAQYSIIQHLAKYNPSLHPSNYRVEDFSMIHLPDAVGDMAKMINISSFIIEWIPQLRNPLPLCHVQNGSFLNGQFFTDCCTDAPNALIFGDSFIAQLQPYISQYFSKSHYLKISKDYSQFEYYIEHHAPNIVIEESVERNLKFCPTLPIS